jgi:hypothetical protein
MYSPLFDDFYLADGMSGSPVYNVDRDFVEVVASGNAGNGCTSFLPPLSLYNPNFTWEMRDGCDDLPHGGEVRSQGMNQGGIPYLARLVPRPYLSVFPLDDVSYILPLDGTPSPAQTVYTASASPTEIGNTTLSAYLSTPPGGEPALLHVGGYTGSLAPGATTAVPVTASVPVGTPCGVYDRYMVVADVSNGFGDKMLHRFEIGMSDFDVSASDSNPYLCNESAGACTLLNAVRSSSGIV